MTSALAVPTDITWPPQCVLLHSPDRSSDKTEKVVVLQPQVILLETFVPGMGIFILLTPLCSLAALVGEDHGEVTD